MALGILISSAVKPSQPYLSGWDRPVLKLSSKFADPLCRAYGLLRYRMVAPLDPKKFDNCSTVIREIAYRTLIGAGAIGLIAAAPLPVLGGALILGTGHKVLRAVGFALQKENFTHVRGKAPEKTLSDQLKVMTWNVCGPAAGFPYDHGGVVGWRDRLDGLVKKIESEDPDVLVLQEIYDAALGEALIEKLNDRYAHFYFHLGASVMGSVGGVMVLSKCATHRFQNTDFSTNDWTLKRGFATLEIKANPSDTMPAARIIGTHLIHGNSETAMAKRAVQVDEIAKSVLASDRTVPTLLAGDFNIERDGEEGKVLNRHVWNAYRRSEPTCTNRLVQQWDLKAQSVWDELIDNISLFKSGKQLEIAECHLSKSFDEKFDTRTALSDHHAIVATFKRV